MIQDLRDITTKKGESMCMPGWFNSGTEDGVVSWCPKGDVISESRGLGDGGCLKESFDESKKDIRESYELRVNSNKEKSKTKKIKVEAADREIHKTKDRDKAKSKEKTKEKSRDKDPKDRDSKDKKKGHRRKRSL